MQRPPQLVIFDCDGVLVDSETIAIEVLVAQLGAAGAAVTANDVLERFLGRSTASMRDILRLEFGFRFDELAAETLWQATAERFRAGLRAVPGVRKTIGRLAIPACVASSSSIERIRLSLELTGLLEMLDPHLYSASMVAKGKPAPDLFLHAATGMGVAPGDCVVVEDSPAGIAAAQAAGMRVFAFCGASHAAHPALAKALAACQPDSIFDDMCLLPDMLRAPARQAS